MFYKKENESQNFFSVCFASGKDDIAKPHWTWLQGEFYAFY